MSLQSIQITDFATLVYECCKCIPKGRVTTYHHIEKHIGHPNSSRAVGHVLSKNPFPSEIVPCHRVVNAKGCLSGYFGQTTTDALNDKANLLRKEGVLVENNAIVDLKNKLFSFV